VFCSVFLRVSSFALFLTLLSLTSQQIDGMCLLLYHRGAHDGHYDVIGGGDRYYGRGCKRRRCSSPLPSSDGFYGGMDRTTVGEEMMTKSSLCFLSLYIVLSLCYTPRREMREEMRDKRTGRRRRGRRREKRAPSLFSSSLIGGDVTVFPLWPSHICKYRSHTADRYIHSTRCRSLSCHVSHPCLSFLLHSGTLHRLTSTRATPPFTSKGLSLSYAP
jgi:hypothetical protein